MKCIIPDGETKIGRNAFSRNIELTEIDIAKSVTRIYGRAFEGCTRLEKLEIPEGVINIGEAAFSGCIRLEKLKIPDRVTSIEDFTFSGCSGLIEIEIPDKVTNIGDFAFHECTKLIKLKIPYGVTRIGMNAFSGCGKLAEICIMEDGSFILGKNIQDENKNSNKVKVKQIEDNISDIDIFKYVIENKNNFKEIANLVEGLNKNKNQIKIPFEYIKHLINNQKSNCFMKNSDFRIFNSEFKNINEQLENYTEEERLDFFKFANALGCFSNDQWLDKNGIPTQTIVAQKATSVISKMLKTDVLKLRELS